MVKSRGTRRIGQVAAPRTGDAKVDKALGELTAQANRAVAGMFAQAVAFEASLEWGLNKVGHGLGRPVPHFTYAAPSTEGVVLTSRQADNPSPDKQVWIQMAGADATKVLLVLFPAVN